MTRGIRVNGGNAAKFGSFAGCPCRSSVVVTGSGTVRMNGAPAARATDLTSDGAIIGGSSNVVIGGPRVGGALGTAEAQTCACQSAASTRASGRTTQSYGNCGLEASRNAINAKRAADGLPPVTEDELMAYALANHLAGNHPGKGNHGCTNSNDRIAVLAHYGIGAEAKPETVDGIADAVSEGKHVNVSVHPLYWKELLGQKIEPDPANPASWLHEIDVTGMEFDADGNIVGFVVNDTGAGVCGYEISAARLDECLEKRALMVVSKERVW